MLPPKPVSTQQPFKQTNFSDLKPSSKKSAREPVHEQ